MTLKVVLVGLNRTRGFHAISLPDSLRKSRILATYSVLTGMHGMLSANSRHFTMTLKTKTSPSPHSWFEKRP